MPKILSLTFASLAVAAATLFAPQAWSGIVISVAGSGQVLPGVDCPPPPALPLDCELTATGKYLDTTGTYGPWVFTSPFTAFSANQPSPTQFLNAGTFTYDDPSALNNDFFGTFTGVFDASTFTALHSYVITGGTGVFAGAGGTGTGSVQINPDLTYVERARFHVPEPRTLALLLAGLVPLLVDRRRERR
jgi:hypothetical protein